jgi:topoisomerase-4 subunit A
MLKKIIAALEAILSDESKLCGVIKDELRKIKKEYGTPRKTEIREEAREINISAEDLIIKENVMVVLTKQGYIKKVPIKSYTAANGEETTVKPGDYAVNIFDTTTVNKLLIFTKLGNYIYIPINDIPFCKWKDLGKHVSNLVTTNPEDEVITSIVVNDESCTDEVVFFTKNGMVKRTPISDFVVSRYTKLYTSMKLKDDDIITNIERAKDNTLIVTKTGYYISYKTNEIPVASAKASGVKGINLKDDEVVSGLQYNVADEFLNIFTNQKTAKRIRLTDLTQLTRAKRGSMVIKKVKTTNYEIVTSLITMTKDQIGLTMLEDIGILKNTDIPIMDLTSTGSSIAKKKFLSAFVFTDIESIGEAEVKKEVKPKEPVDKQEELKFVEEFKI